MVHSSLEESLAETCPNCGKNHNAKFFSLFVGDMHYVVGDCDTCGYRIEIPKHDLGSGLFMSDGSVTTVDDMFRKQHTDHMKEEVQVRSDQKIEPVTSSLRRHKMRFLDNEPITEMRER